MLIVSSSIALVIKALKELECDCKKTKNIKHNGNISPHDAIDISRVVCSRSMVRDIFGTIKETHHFHLYWLHKNIILADHPQNIYATRMSLSSFDLNRLVIK